MVETNLKLNTLVTGLYVRRFDFNNYVITNRIVLYAYMYVFLLYGGWWCVLEHSRPTCNLSTWYPPSSRILLGRLQVLIACILIYLIYNSIYWIQYTSIWHYWIRINNYINFWYNIYQYRVISKIEKPCTYWTRQSNRIGYMQGWI